MNGAQAPEQPDLRSRWGLDPSVTFLNHGSFGACPLSVLQYQNELRAQLEAEPVRFMVRELEPLLDDARAALARFIGADADGLVFVPNATVGVNTVLASIRFEPGDEILVNDHEYNACLNAAHYYAERAGARVVCARPPLPLVHPEEAAAAILSKLSARTRLVLVSHVTSATALVLPLKRLLGLIESRARELGAGTQVLVDGAHAPGMIDLNVGELGAAYYTGNCHKWICAPKGAGFLWVREDQRARVRPLVISHGANSTRTDRARFLLEFGWMGTGDPTPALCVPRALCEMARMIDPGAGESDAQLDAAWKTIRARNRALALAARDMLCASLRVAPPAPDSMIGSMACVPLPPRDPSRYPDGLPPTIHHDALQDALETRHGIQVPITLFPMARDLAPGAVRRRWVRVSAQLYNLPEQYERLARALVEELGREGRGAV